MRDKNYIVYERISPSGHSYVGYTSQELMVRWQQKVGEVKTQHVHFIMLL